MQKSSFEDFIRRARGVHGEKYLYPEQAWNGYRARVTVVCPEHGEFRPLASNHVSKTGCPTCADLSKYVSVGEFKRRVKLHHPQLDLSRSEYVGAVAPVTVGCPDHGWVRVTAEHLMSGRSGCPECGKVRAGMARRLDFDTWVSRCRSAHGEKYRYLSVRWDREAVMTIECPEHGVFTQSARMHANGQGCPTCANDQRPGRPRQPIENYLNASRLMHAGRYEYGEDPDFPYLNIVCPTHGPFVQLGKDHVKGHGCRKCSLAGESRSQQELEAYCRTLGIAVISNYKFLGRRELDIFFPDLNLAVEYQGIYWHSTARSDRLNIARKHRLAAANGVRVISIFEDEWMNRTEAVKGALRHAVGVAPRVYARDCQIDIRPDPDEIMNFYETHHLQGSVRDLGTTLALRHAGEVVLAMTLTRLNSVRGAPAGIGTMELRRLAASCSVVGGASRAFTNLTRLLPSLQRVVSFSDVRCFSGGVYPVMGFVEAGRSRPDYSYVKPPRRHRVPKAQFTRSRLAKLEGFDPALSEAQNMERMGYHRIYDCGKIRWEWARP